MALMQTCHHRKWALQRITVLVFLFCFSSVFCFVIFFRDRVSLYCFGACPGTHSVDQAGLKLTEIHLPLPPSLVLELKACANMVQHKEQLLGVVTHVSSQHFHELRQEDHQNIKSSVAN